MRTLTLLRKVAGHALLCSLPMLLGGCFFLCTVNQENSELKYDEQLLNGAMQNMLRKGGCALLPLTMMDSANPSSDLRYFTEGEESLGLVRFAGSEWYLRVAADGSLLAGPPRLSSAVIESASAVKLGNEWLFSTCSGGQVGLSTIAGATEVHLSNWPMPGCDGLVGKASSGERVAVARRNEAGAVEAGFIAPRATELESIRTTWLHGVIRFVDEPRPGVLSVVTENAGQWTYRELGQDGSIAAERSTAEPGPALGKSPSVRRGPNGLLVVAGDRLFEWKVADDGSVRQIAAADSPAIGSATWNSMPWFGGAQAMSWEQNNEEPGLVVPLEYRSRAATSDGFTVLRPAATPCGDDVLCRNIGESNLLGVIDHQGKPWGVYSTWAWARLPGPNREVLHYLHGLFASPLFEVSGSTSGFACPGLSFDADSGAGGSGADSAAGSGGSGPQDSSAGGSSGSDSSAGGSSGEGGQSGAGGDDASAGASGEAGQGGAAGKDAGEDGGEGGAVTEGGADVVTEAESGPAFGQLPQIGGYEFNQMLPDYQLSFEVTGSRFDSTSRVRLFGKEQTTILTSPTSLKVGPVTTPSQQGAYPMVVSGGTGGAYDSNTVYVRILSFSGAMMLDDYGSSSAMPGDTLRVYGRHFPATDPPFLLSDVSNTQVPVQLAGNVTWEGTQFQSATLTVPATWTSGPLAAQESSTLARLFVGRYFSVGQDLARLPGAAVSATNANTNTPASNATDGDLATHWMAATSCGSTCGSTGPELRVALAGPSAVSRIVVRGIRTLPSITNVVRSRLSLEGAGNSVLWQDDWEHPPTNAYDLEIVLPAAVPGVEAVSLRVLQDSGALPGVAELAVLPY